jgi:hypothetical protein
MQNPTFFWRQVVLLTSCMLGDRIADDIVRVPPKLKCTFWWIDECLGEDGMIS